MTKSPKFSPEVRERAVRLVREQRGAARPPPEVLRRFVDQHRDVFGVEPICQGLQIAPPGYWRHAARLRDTSQRCARAIRDERLGYEIKRVWQASPQV